MDRIYVNINGKKAKIELNSKIAPNTIEKIKSILPQKIFLHYAKFAGEEVFGILPVMIPMENKTNVNNLEKGSVVYYPERQFFCIFYGDIQDEDANVTVIGKLVADKNFINEMEKVRYNQGICMLIRNEDNFENNDNDYKIYNHIINVNFDWHNLPKEFNTLISRKGVMQPGGPIIYAEGETRKLADILWIFYMYYKKENNAPLDLLRDLLVQSINRIGGWCGLKESAEVINQYLFLLMKQDSDKLVILEDMILYVNKLNMGIDLLIPWDKCNESIKEYYKEDNLKCLMGK